MNTTEYRAFVAQNFVKRNTGQEGLIHAALGVVTELGELLDIHKKEWVYGKVPADGHVVAKLRKRYPSNYNDADAVARADKQQEAA